MFLFADVIREIDSGFTLENAKLRWIGQCWSRSRFVRSSMNLDRVVGFEDLR